MNRREIREKVFMMLFRIEFCEPEDRDEQLDIFNWELEHDEDTQEELPADEKYQEQVAYIRAKCDAIMQKTQELDEIIGAASTGWKTSRMAKVDLAILRLAVYEIRFEEEIPDKVAINEAVELAKKYGTDNSASFVNGVLAKIVK